MLDVNAAARRRSGSTDHSVAFLVPRHRGRLVAFGTAREFPDRRRKRIASASPGDIESANRDLPFQDLRDDRAFDPPIR
jgi:hypothetical protein